jgi:CBS domain-containing protein
MSWPERFGPRPSLPLPTKAIHQGAPGRSSTNMSDIAMYEQPLKYLMDPKKLLVAAPETTVYDAARLMADRNVGAVLVVRDRMLRGIFTERDAVKRVIAKGLDIRTTPLSEVMTSDPQALAPEESFGYALMLMHENGFRHVPVVKDGVPIGIVSARNALDPDLEEFNSEFERRKHFSARRAV